MQKKVCTFSSIQDETWPHTLQQKVLLAQTDDSVQFSLGGAVT